MDLTDTRSPIRKHAFSANKNETIKKSTSHHRVECGCIQIMVKSDLVPNIASGQSIRAVPRLAKNGLGPLLIDYPRTDGE